MSELLRTWVDKRSTIQNNQILMTKIMNDQEDSIERINQKYHEANQYYQTIYQNYS
jgi:hypothetical protein